MKGGGVLKTKWKQVICGFLCAAFFLSLIQGATPEAEAATVKTFQLAQAQSLAVSNSPDVSKLYNQILLKEMKYIEAMKGLKAKIKNKKSFRWTPLLSFKFPEQFNLTEEYEINMKPLSLQVEIGNLKHELANERYNVLADVNNTYVSAYILYVSRIYNPIATYAGGDIESIESAHARGANIVSSKNRLVSELDYAREARSFSTAIDKVKCIAGRDIDGRRDDKLISIAVMMRDYADGAYSFNGIKERLKERLLERSETTLDPQNLILSEPIYVEISVDVWAETDQVNNFFAIQTAIKDRVSAFLDPLSHGGRGGWEIGELPTESQIRMMLQSIKTDALVRRYIITARYVDRRGVHESDLDALRGNPFMIGVSGEHRVHISLPR
jgi:hypothetical protein